MKNYNEVTKDLLERRDRYTAEQNKRRKRIMNVTASLGCFCLVALLGFGVWQVGSFGPDQPDQTAEDALYHGIKDNFDEKNGESTDNPAVNNKIVVHAIDGITSERIKIDLRAEDFVEMTRDEMKEYYGVNYVPEVPDDIKPWKNERCGIYRRDGGSGAVYLDIDILNYSNEDFTRNVNLEVAKGGYPLIDYVYFEPTEESSVINNTDVMIGHTLNGYYYAEFMYSNVGFVLSADGVTQDEFVAIIASVIR